MNNRTILQYCYGENMSQNQASVQAGQYVEVLVNMPHAALYKGDVFKVLAVGEHDRYKLGAVLYFKTLSEKVCEAIELVWYGYKMWTPWILEGDMEITSSIIDEIKVGKTKTPSDINRHSNYCCIPCRSDFNKKFKIITPVGFSKDDVVSYTKANEEGLTSKVLATYVDGEEGVQYTLNEVPMAWDSPVDAQHLNLLFSPAKNRNLTSQDVLGKTYTVGDYLKAGKDLEKFGIKKGDVLRIRAIGKNSYWGTVAIFQSVTTRVVESQNKLSGNDADCKITSVHIDDDTFAIGQKFEHLPEGYFLAPISPYFDKCDKPIGVFEGDFVSDLQNRTKYIVSYESQMCCFFDSNEQTDVIDYNKSDGYICSRININSLTLLFSPAENQNLFEVQSEPDGDRVYGPDDYIKIGDIVKSRCGMQFRVSGILRNKSTRVKSLFFLRNNRSDGAYFNGKTLYGFACLPSRRCRKIIANQQDAPESDTQSLIADIVKGLKTPIRHPTSEEIYKYLQKAPQTSCLEELTGDVSISRLPSFGADDDPRKTKEDGGPQSNINNLKVEGGELEYWRDWVREVQNGLKLPLAESGRIAAVQRQSKNDADFIVRGRGEKAGKITMRIPRIDFWKVALTPEKESDKFVRISQDFLAYFVPGIRSFGMKSLTKIGLTGVCLLVLGLSIFGKDLFSYIGTGAGLVKNSVKDAVPIQFEIDNAKSVVAKLVPDIKTNLTLIAQEEVELAKINSEIKNHNNDLEIAKEEMLTLRNDLKDVKVVSYTYAGKSFTRGQVEANLASRLERYQVKEAARDNLMKVAAIRQNSLETARQKLNAMMDQKRQLEVQLESLNARLKLVDLAKTTSSYNFDNSSLANAKELVSQLSSRLDVEEKLANVDTLNAEVPVKEDALMHANIADRVTEYLGGKNNEPQEVATK